MQIFGQVWLWSLGSFLLGVLFTWLLLVRPARSRVVELEDEARHTPLPRQHQQTRVAEPVTGHPDGQPGPSSTDRFLDDLFEHQRPPHLPPVAPPPSMQQTQTIPPVDPAEPPHPMDSRPEVQQPVEPPRSEPLRPVQPPMVSATQPGPTAPPEPPLPDESDTELSDAPFSQFTHSTTVFVPPELPSQPDVSPTGEDWFSKEDEEDPHAITDVEEDEEVDAGGTIFNQHTTPIPAEMIRSLDDSQPEPVREPEPEPEPEPLSSAETTQYIESPATPADLVTDPDPAPLPVRVPRRKAEAAAAEQPAEGGRSLFEPVVPVGDQSEEPADDDFVPPGPFGPGSAMPLPGGGAPTPEFNVKASVTALRYCTQDNPQFDRIVAEVWFRTPSDAERVGFRVLS